MPKNRNRNTDNNNSKIVGVPNAPTQAEKRSRVAELLKNAGNVLKEVAIKSTETSALMNDGNENNQNLKKAADLLAKAEKIYTDAQKKLEEYSEFEANFASLKEEHDRLVAKIELLYSNEEAQRIRDEEKAIITAANSDAERIIRNAKQESSQNADKVIAEARTQAKIIRDEADKTLSEARTNAESIAKARAEEIIANAKYQSEQKLQEAIDAGKRITQNATSMMEERKALAEQERISIVEFAKTMAVEILKNADEEKAKTVKLNDELRDQVRALAEERSRVSSSINQKLAEALKDENERLEKLAADLRKRENAVVEKQEDLDVLEEELRSEKTAFRTRVNTAVEEKHAALLNELAVKRELLNNMSVDNRKLEKKYHDLLEKSTHQFNAAKLHEQIIDLEKELELYRENNITKENISEYLGLKKKLDDANQTKSKIMAQLDAVNAKYYAVLNSNEQLAQTMKENTQLREKIRQLKEDLDNTKVISRDSMVAPIKNPPEIMKVDRSDYAPLTDDDEINWLKNIKDKAEMGGIRFTMRQLTAYHTALKTGDWSPMTVLAGVSGTGKSEMPKQYAIHGGFNFISIPVKPDWDSPSSLFGYYNTIENKFEATELVRALYQVQSGKDHQDEMLLVLLDELNLAHPEQYFADLLSKFEGARGDNESAKYEIALGGGANPELLNIGSNVLWTGTMNEDETTKGLSDKVVDRSTIITFPRPKKLFNRSNAKNVPQEFILNTSIWQRWKLATNEIEKRFSAKVDENTDTDTLRTTMKQYKKIIQDINENMDKMGRFLGHRVWQGIQNYIFNYPYVIKYFSENNDEKLKEALNYAFCDALAFKVMPKLRGLEVRGDNEEYLEIIKDIIETNVPDLSTDFKNSRKLTTELFHWHSAEFMEGEDFM